MSIRTDLLRRKMQALLARRSPPQQIKGNEQAQLDEIRSLVRIIEKYAPQDGIETWWEDFEDELLGKSSTYSWPLQSSIVAAAKAVTPRSDSSKPGEGWNPDTMRIAAERINAAEPVGDEWLFGSNAEALLRSGMVHSDAIRRYRSGLFLSERELLGEDEAKKRETERLSGRARIAQGANAPADKRHVREDQESASGMFEEGAA